MPLNRLQCQTLTFNVCSTSRGSRLIHVRHAWDPGRCLGSTGRPKLRPIASFAVHATGHGMKDPKQSPRNSNLVLKVDALAHSPGRRNQGAWAELLETYLPKRLRKTYEGTENTEDNTVIEQDISALPTLLAQARYIAEVDLLSYIGIHQGRWEATIWLVESMLEKCQDYQQGDEPSRQLRLPSWPFEARTLNELTANAIDVELPEAIDVPLDDLFNWDARRSKAGASSVARQCLGEILQSLGCMVLQAEDQSAGDPNYQAIMSLVLDILAQMHHVNVMPANLYNYTPAKDESVVQRPPTIYLLSARIMAVLSDVAWKKHWIAEMARAKELGYDLPPARVEPLLPRVGAEVWLDLILWICVEGGWVKEAAWIISEMEKRKTDRNSQWSVISWDDICQTKAPDLEWTAMLKLQLEKSRLNQSTGIEIANRGTSSVEMGQRRVSREVVLAILDGITNRPSTNVEVYGDRVMKVQQNMRNCKNLLERHNLKLGRGHLNSLILRTIESASLRTESSLSVLSRILDTNPVLDSASDTSAQLDTSPEGDRLDFSAAMLGLLHRILYMYSECGNFQGSLQALRDIQNLIDGNRNVYIREFANELKERLRRGQEDSGLTGNLQSRTSPLLHPQIPVHVIARLLDFVAENKFAELGHWLIHNEDIDGGIIQAHMYDDSSLQPALLRFATATKDNELLTRVLERLQPPLSGFILHPLLRCQVALNKWNAVEDILKHFHATPELSWSPSDAMAIAAAIVKPQPSTARRNWLGRAFGMLKDLLQGNYDPPQSASQRFDPSRMQKANQLKRILRSVPGKPFDNLTFEPARETGRYSNVVEVPARAFNVLLEAIVEQHGSAAGKAFWQRWCLHPSETTLRVDNFPIGLEQRTEKVVIPTIYMLRTVVRPLAQRLREHKAESNATSTNSTEQNESPAKTVADPPTSHGDQELIEWAVSMYRAFGLNNKAINGEMPGAIKYSKERTTS